MNRLTILAVDDVEANRISLKYLIEEYCDDIDIILASSGEDGLKEAYTNEIDLIILDIQMPGMDGFETAKYLKSNPKTEHIPIIFLTAAFKKEEFQQKGFEVGAIDYLTKPIEDLQFINKLKLYKEVIYKTKELESLNKELETANKNLEKFIDTQDNIVILTDGKEVSFANKRFYEFFDFKDMEHFKQKHHGISEFFIENDRFFHLGKINDDYIWTEKIQEIPDSERIVSMMGKDFKIHAFSISINSFDKKTLIVSFTDISQTMLNHIKLEEKTIHDTLTGAFNREFFEENYINLIQEYHTSDHKLAVALLDIDHFKLVNDTYGHDVGDDVLVRFVETVNKNTRKEDIFIRWGGEEFVMLLKIQSEEDLARILEHLRKTIETQNFPTVGQKTCSIGATIYKDGEDISNTIKRADISVYEAKKSGRNKVIVQ